MDLAGEEVRSDGGEGNVNTRTWDHLFAQGLIAAHANRPDVAMMKINTTALSLLESRSTSAMVSAVVTITVASMVPIHHIHHRHR